MVQPEKKKRERVLNYLRNYSFKIFKTGLKIIEVLSQVGKKPWKKKTRRRHAKTLIRLTLYIRVREIISGSLHF